MADVNALRRNTSGIDANGTQDESPDNHRAKPRKRAFSRRLGPSREISFSQDSASPSRVYFGSYVRNTRSRANSIYDGSSNIATSRKSVSHLQLRDLLSGIDDTDTYGVHEMRDGFFDAAFTRTAILTKATSCDEDEYEPPSVTTSIVEAIWEVSYKQWDALNDTFWEVLTTRVGIRLLKAFLGFYIAYILCLIPRTRDWLGPYAHILPISAIINHPARSVGSQIDGALQTCFGMTIGLLWGGLAVFTTTSTADAAEGYGAATLPFLMLFTSVLGWLRCVYGRFFQAVISAGIALFYMCLADNLLPTSGLDANIWTRFANFAIPFALGQALCLVINVLVFPSAGNRPLSRAFHKAIKTIRSSLVLPRPRDLNRNRQLAICFVQVSQAVRDFTLDLSFSRYKPSHAVALRNLVQGVLRAVIALEPDTKLFCSSNEINEDDDLEPARMVSNILAGPTRALIDALDQALRKVDNVVMHISDLEGSSKTATATLDSVTATLDLLRSRQSDIDSAQYTLSQKDIGPAFSSTHKEVVELFKFVNHIQQTSDKVLQLLEHTQKMLAEKPRWALYLPTYPWSKSIHRMNPTVRHDRGGLTAGFYFRNKHELEKSMAELHSRDWKPLNEKNPACGNPKLKQSWTFDQLKDGTTSTPDTKKQSTLRHAIWSIGHRLQDFEARFAVKVTLLCSLISIPGLLPQSADWWYPNDCWWVVVTVWMMMHPRVGGNMTDIFVRTICTILGAAWAGLAYAVGSGNPYVIAVFCAMFMIPMIYRYTQSNHPRSGIMGCITFTVCSLLIYSEEDRSTNSIVWVAWTRGLVFIVGVVTAITVNWVLWPFIARHEARKSLANMVLNSAIIYRNVIARYVYHSGGQEPGPEDITRSEVLEGRLREGFVRLRQLMDLTKHEIRLRAPFDDRPYYALITACEEFFDRLVDLRQSSLFFKPPHPSPADDLKHNILALRRDAVASILMTLYIIAGSLRSHRPLPMYLPSAAESRRRLIDAMELIESEKAEQGRTRRSERRGWTAVYEFAYSAALTDIVGQVLDLENRTREIVGIIGSHSNPIH